MNSFSNPPIKRSFQEIALLILSLLSHTLAFSQTYNWNSVAIGGGGFVSGIITSKTEQNVMFARTDVGGAYRWDATNAKWIPLLDWNSESETSWQGVESIAMDPKASKNVYMLVGTDYFNGGKTAILRSTDYGNTFAVTDVTSQFKAHGNGMGRQNGEKLVVDPNLGSILFCGSRRNGLFKSTNSGASWSNVTSTGSGTANDNGISFVLIDPQSGTSGNASQTIFFGVSQTSNNFYKSTNGGASFSPVTGGPSLMPQRAVLASDGNMYITYADKEGPWNISSGAIWKYNTSTGAWTNVTPVLSGATPGFGGISVDPNNPNRLIASTTNLYWTQFPNSYGDRMFLSTNGGTSWTDLVGTAGITVNPNGCTWITGKSIHWAGCIEFNPFNTAQAFVISGNGIFVCDNVNTSTTTWKFLVKGLEETVALDMVSITGGPLVSAIGDYDGFVHTDITQYSPIHTPNIGTTTGLAVAALSTSKMVRVGGDNTGGKMYYTNNQGTSWTQTASINGYKGKLALSANGNTILHNPEGSSTMYRSTNNGSSWSTSNGVNITDGVPVADMVNSNKFYAYNKTSGSVMVSTDGGANFSAAANVGTYGSPIMRTVPGIEGDIWIAMYNGGLKRSTNSGTSFTNISGVTACSAVGFGKAAPTASYHTVYIWGTVGGVTGVFASIDQGATWTRVNDDAHEYGGPGNGQFVIGDMNVFGRVYMSTVGRGIAYGEISTATCTATITTPSTSFCTGGSTILTASAGSTYKWSNASGIISGATNATYTATAAGSYTVEVTNASGCVATSTATVITVNSLPTATITASATSFCTGGSVVLSANTGSGLTYQWSNAAGTITNATNATYTATAAGTYTVKVTNANNCSTTSTGTAITVNSAPTATITASATSFCTGGAATLSANTGSGLTYQWSNTAGTIASATNAAYTATAAGAYTVTVSNTNCSATSSATTITVNSAPTATITASATSFCTGGSATLSANTGANLTYQWSNTAGTIASATNATYTATAASTYTVKVTNASNCSTTSTGTAITVNSAPTATITASATSFCAGGSAILSANTGANLTYQWSNTAGTIASATNATYTATAASTYTVTVTNASNCSTISTGTVITVNTAPTATITASATSFCAGGSATLSANTGSGLTYQWSNTAGTISGATNAVYTATAAGAYTVTVSNTNCSATSAATTITVNTAPTATITASATSFCAGGSATLSANTGSGLTYQWSNTAGTISGATNAVYTATAAGAYTVTVSNTNCSATSAATTITVNAAPAATITASSTSFCTGGSATLSANTGTGLIYQWSNAAGTISGATNATYTTSIAGTFTVKVTNSNSCSATSAPITITVTASQTATITSSSNSFCAGGSIVLSANTGTGLTYQWSNTAGTISGATNATYTATAASTYIVAVSNGTCSGTSAGKVITVNTLPTATITASATSFCAGGSATLTANTGTNLTYQWSNAAGTITGATNGTYTATAAGAYTVTVTNSNNCSATSSVTTITVDALPNATITASATSFCTGGSVVLSANTGTGLTYQWSNTAGTISGATNAAYTATTAGTYSVKVTNSNTCSATSAPITITVTSSITWYQDLDGDGKGDPNATITSCTQPTGYVSVAGDACPNDPAKIAAGNCGCGQTEQSCLDCAGVPNGGAYFDNCSVCVGGNTGNTPCTTTATKNGTSTQISVSPQPFQNTTTIKLENLGNIKSITIVNTAGALIEQRENINTTEIILGESLASGMYSVIIHTENEVYTTKIVKF